jgi:hypothetical protein
VFDPWTSALYFNGKKTTLKGLADLDAASEIISKG